MAVRVGRGTASGPTALADDAARAEAGAHDDTLVAGSSVLPGDAAVSVEGSAPDLAPAGADRRDRPRPDREVRCVIAEAEPGPFTAAGVLAVLDEGERLG